MEFDIDKFTKRAYAILKTADKKCNGKFIYEVTNIEEARSCVKKIRNIFFNELGMERDEVYKLLSPFGFLFKKKEQEENE